MSFLLSVCHFLVYCGDPPVVLGESIRVLDKYSGLGCIWTRFTVRLHLSTWLHLLCCCLNLQNSRHSRNRSTLHSGWRDFFFFIGQWDGCCAWPVKWHNGWYPAHEWPLLERLPPSTGDKVLVKWWPLPPSHVCYNSFCFYGLIMEITVLQITMPGRRDLTQRWLCL